jgi:hypothetical protein
MLQCTVVNWPDVFLVNIETCVGQFYDVIDECFDLYVSKLVTGGGPGLKYPWFDREVRNLDSNKTKAYKFMKRVLKTYERTGDEEDTACARFQNLRGDFKSLHRMKHGIKSDPLSFFKFANMKRNSSGFIDVL